jgi:hypothetical protein
MQQTAGADMLRLGAWTGITRPHVCGDVAGLPGPERQSSDQGGCFWSAEMSPERGVVTLPEDATAKVAAFGNAQAARFTLSSSDEQATSDGERATRRSVGWRGDGLPSSLRSTAPPTEVAAPMKMGAKYESICISAFHAATNSGESLEMPLRVDHGRRNGNLSCEQLYPGSTKRRERSGGSPSRPCIDPGEKPVVLRSGARHQDS